MENQNSFTPPRHWIGPEELSAGYWNDATTLEKRSQEFHDKPIETLDMIERMDGKGLARRDFLTIMGASMAMAGFACARRPVHKIIPYVVQPEEIVPGIANYYAGLYERAEDSESISGMGLGLFIANEIVQGHRGVIRLESEFGRGSKFIVELPKNSEDRIQALENHIT